jgi:hypothetical protein
LRKANATLPGRSQSEGQANGLNRPSALEFRIKRIPGDIRDWRIVGLGQFVSTAKTNNQRWFSMMATSTSWPRYAGRQCIFLCREIIATEQTRERLVAMQDLQNSNNVICFLKGSGEIEKSKSASI